MTLRSPIDDGNLVPGRYTRTSFGGDNLQATPPTPAPDPLFFYMVNQVGVLMTNAAGVQMVL